jgi:hypothetical protein
MLPTDPRMKRAFENALGRYPGVSLLPASDEEGFSVPFKKEGVEYEVQVRLTNAGAFVTQVPTELIIDNLGFPYDDATRGVWVMREMLADVRLFDGYITAGTSPGNLEAEGWVAHVLANAKDVEDDSDDEVPQFLNVNEALAAII